MGDKIGIINEIGDLGLGFDELSERDKKVIQESSKREDKKKQN